MSTHRIRVRELENEKWADRHNVFHELLPYGYRSFDPIEALQAFRTTFRGLGEYKQLYQASDVREIGGFDLRRSNASEYIYWSGSWPALTHRKNNPHSYANPLYVHDVYPPITDTDQRERLIEQTLDMPHWTDGRLAQAFGISTSGARKYRVNRHGKHGRHKRDMDKFARTIKTINSWGYTYRELASAFPYKWSTLQKQVELYAGDFAPPENPLDQNL